MMRLGAAASLFFFSVGSVFAADLPSRQAAPVFAPPPLPAFTWTGFYGGATAGVISQSARLSTSIAPGSHLVLPQNLATVSTAGSGTARQVGFTGGGEVGYNYQVGPLLVGLEGDAAYTGGTPSITGTGTLVPARNALSVRTSERTDFLATGRARIGYAVDRTLFYATGGVALTNQTFSQSYADALFNASGQLSESRLRAGFAVGGGVEYAFNPNWSIKAEYLYAEFGGGSGSYLISSRTGGANRLTVGGGRQELQLGRIGLNYRFYSLAPIVARY